MDLWTFYMLLVAAVCGLAITARLCWGEPYQAETERYHGVRVVIAPVGELWGWETLGNVGRDYTRAAARKSARRVIQAREYAYERGSLPVRIAATAA